MASCCVDPTATANSTTAAVVTAGHVTFVTGKSEDTNAFTYGRPLSTERNP